MHPIAGRTPSARSVRTAYCRALRQISKRSTHEARVTGTAFRVESERKLTHRGENRPLAQQRATMINFAPSGYKHLLPATAMFEHRYQPLLPRHRFLKRLVRHCGMASCIVFGTLGMGVCGYHYLGGLCWLDALLNASMILSGMGPVDELHTASAKLFASFYALFSGVAFVT